MTRGRLFPPVQDSLYLRGIHSPRQGPGIWGTGRARGRAMQRSSTQNTGRGAVQRASSLRAEEDPCCPQAPWAQAPGVQLDFQKEAGDQHNCPGTQTPAGGECGPAPARG